IYLGQRNDAEIAVNYVKLATIQRYRTRWAAAKPLYIQAAELAEKAGQPYVQGEALSGLANAEDSLRETGAALRHATKAMELLATKPDTTALFDATLLKGEVLKRQGNLAGAMESAVMALAISPPPPKGYLAYAYLDRGDIYIELASRCVGQQRGLSVCAERAALAKSDTLRAQAIAREAGWNGIASLIDSALRRIAANEMIRRNLEATDESLRKTGIFSPKRPENVGRGPVRAVVQPENVQAMRQLVAQEREFMASAGAYAELVAAQTAYTEGQLSEASGRLDEALANYIKAINLVERDRGLISSDAARATFAEDKSQYYNAATRILLAQKRYSEAFTRSEQARSRAMTDLLASRKIQLSNTADQKYFSAAMQLRAKIASHQEKIFALVSSGADATDIASEKAAIQSLEAELQSLTTRMAAEAPKALELSAEPPVTLERLQAAMKAEQFEVLQYTVLDTDLILWHVRADAVEVQSVFLPRRILQEKVGKFQASLTTPNAAFDEPTAKELFLFLIQPALERVRSRRLVIIANQQLHALAFNALVDPSDGQYLGERFQLSYAPSATVLLHLAAARPIGKARAYVVSDSTIPGSEAEAKLVAALYADGRANGVRPLTTKAELKSTVGGNDLVHLSVHGVFDGAEPLFSYLKLKPDGADDGKLTAAEMFGLPLQDARLVVLSACESGNAAVSGGDEVVGILRGLLYAGAANILVSQWAVDPVATSRWMQAF
ncbi:MAG TPA: CHAT domain-containing protein, partial [Variovorax sp.]|nr:CHAT domain-containing protein [Variovorax sp.]